MWYLLLVLSYYLIIIINKKKRKKKIWYDDWLLLCSIFSKRSQPTQISRAIILHMVCLKHFFGFSVSGMRHTCIHPNTRPPRTRDNFNNVCYNHHSTSSSKTVSVYNDPSINDGHTFFALTTTTPYSTTSLRGSVGPGTTLIWGMYLSITMVLITLIYIQNTNNSLE